MFAELLRNHEHLLDLPVVSMLLFMSVFVAVTVQAFRPRKATLDQLANLPLLDDSGVAHRAHGVDHD